MTDPQRDVLMAQAATLEQSMDNLRESLDSVEQAEKTNRAVLWVLGVVAFLSVVAIVVAIVVSVQASNASDDAKQAVSQANINKRAQIASCQATNDTRRVALQLWDFLLTASAHNSPPPAPEVQRQLNQFQRMVNAAYKARDCSAGALAASPTH